MTVRQNNSSETLRLCLQVDTEDTGNTDDVRLCFRQFGVGAVLVREKVIQQGARLRWNKKQDENKTWRKTKRDAAADISYRF